MLLFRSHRLYPPRVVVWPGVRNTGFLTVATTELHGRHTHARTHARAIAAQTNCGVRPVTMGGAHRVGASPSRSGAISCRPKRDGTSEKNRWRRGMRMNRRRRPNDAENMGWWCAGSDGGGRGHCGLSAAAEETTSYYNATATSGDRFSNR